MKSPKRKSPRPIVKVSPKRNKAVSRAEARHNASDDDSHRMLTVSPPAGLAEESATPVSRDVITRWGGHQILATEGHVPVVALFLKLSGNLKPYPLTPAESLFVLQLMVHKWDAKHPFPAYKTIATRMGVSVAYARTIGRTLERKGYLRRILRTGQTVKFDLNRLFQALATEATDYLAQKARRRQDDAAEP